MGRKDLDYWQYAKIYNRCMDVLSKVYTRWYGSAWGVTSSNVTRMADIIADGKNSYTRYERELNDRIYFNQYGCHLYKSQEGKDVSKYVL